MYSHCNCSHCLHVQTLDLDTEILEDAQVVGRMEQQVEEPGSTYIGKGKVQELIDSVAATGAETVIFDDELQPRQLKALEKARN